MCSTRRRRASWKKPRRRDDRHRPLELAMIHYERPQEGRPTIGRNFIFDCFPADSQGGGDGRWIVPEGGNDLGLLRTCYWGVCIGWLVFPALGFSQARASTNKSDDSKWAEVVGEYPELSERMD